MMIIESEFKFTFEKNSLLVWFFNAMIVHTFTQGHFMCSVSVSNFLVLVKIFFKFICVFELPKLCRSGFFGGYVYVCNAEAAT